MYKHDNRAPHAIRKRARAACAAAAAATRRTRNRRTRLTGGPPSGSKMTQLFGSILTEFMFVFPQQPPPPPLQTSHPNPCCPCQSAAVSNADAASIQRIVRENSRNALPHPPAVFPPPPAPPRHHCLVALRAPPLRSICSPFALHRRFHRRPSSCRPRAIMGASCLLLPACCANFLLWRSHPLPDFCRRSSGRLVCCHRESAEWRQRQQRRFGC